MNPFHLELSKIIGRKSSWWIILITSLTFLGTIKIVSYLSVTQDKMPVGLFVDSLQMAILQFSIGFTFLPLWIAISIGSEFQSQHVNLVVFNTSKRAYFTSKLAFILIASLYFTFLSICAYWLALYTNPIEINLPPNSIFVFCFQSLVTNLFGSILMLTVAFIASTPIFSILFFWILSMIELAIILPLKLIFDISSFYTPSNLVAIFYRSSVFNPRKASYINPFEQFDIGYIIAPVFFAGLLGLTYYLFMKRDLKALSD